MSRAQQEEYIKIIKDECSKVSLDPDLFCAIVNAESNWDPDAIRYEKGYPYLSNPSRWSSMASISIATETVLQQLSYGLCQIMGANARVLSYDKPLMNLLDPHENIRIGVEFFKKRCDIHKDIKDKISSYNAGSPIKKDGVYFNQAYVDKVYKYYSQLKT